MFSTAKWCCDENDGEGLWFTNEYSEEEFEDCLLEFTARYKHIPRVVGIDLRYIFYVKDAFLSSWFRFKIECFTKFQKTIINVIVLRFQV